MEFPLKSLAAFGAAFTVTTLLVEWLSTYVLGWYETKWSPHVSFGLYVFAAFLLFIPAALLGFAVGAYLVNTERDGWRRAITGGVFLGFVFFGVSRLILRLDSVVLANTLVWGTLLLGSGCIGAWTRARRAEFVNKR